MASPVAPDPTPGSIPAPSSTPPSTGDGATPGGTPTPPTPWRAPETADPAFRGKSAEEILGIAQTLYGVAQRFNQQGVVAPAAPAPAAPASIPQPIQDDDFVTGGAVRQYVDQAARGFQPVLQQTLQQTAAMAHAFARQQHADAFQRFGPEIEAELSRIPVEMRNLDNITTIVDVVRGRHWRELAEEKARELAASIAPTLRSNGNGLPGSGGPASTTPTLQSDKIPDAWRQKAQAVGLDDAAIADFCRANGMTTQQFYDQFSKGQIAAAVADTPTNRFVTPRSL